MKSTFKFILVFVFTGLLSADVFAENVFQSFLSKETGIKISIEKPMQIFGDKKPGILDYVPNGANHRLPTAECDQSHLENLYIRGKSSPEKIENLKDYIKKCHEQYYSKPFVHELISQFQIFHSVEAHPNVKPITVTLKDGRIIRGYLGLKDGRARPLVIAKCGIFCNPEEFFSHKQAMMQLFEESPFHVLSLASITGTKYVEENKIMGIGGFDEGKQIIDVAKALTAQDSPYKNFFNRVHVVGVSLGGHAALYAGLYSSVNYKNSYKPLIDSVVSMCPVVDLKTSMQNIYKPSFVGFFMNLLTFMNLKKVGKVIPVIGDSMRDIDENGFWDMLEDGSLYQLVVDEAVRTYKEITQRHPWDLYPFEGAQIKTESDFFYYNNFVDKIQMLEVPSLIIGNRDDAIVGFEYNTAKLMDLEKAKKTQDMYILDYKKGNHCAQVVPYGWSFEGKVVREFLLAHSPELHKTNTIYKFPKSVMSTHRFRKFMNSDFNKFYKVRWKFKPDKKYASLYITGQKVQGSYSSCKDRVVARSACTKTNKFKVKLEELPDGFNRPAKSVREAHLWTRLANTQWRILDSNREYINRQALTPEYLIVEQY